MWAEGNPSLPQMWFNFVPVRTDPDCIMVCREGGDAPVRETIYIVLVDYILYVVHVPSYIPILILWCLLAGLLLNQYSISNNAGKT